MHREDGALQRLQIASPNRQHRPKPDLCSSLPRQGPAAAGPTKREQEAERRGEESASLSGWVSGGSDQPF